MRLAEQLRRKLGGWRCRRLGHDWDVVSIDKSPDGKFVEVKEICLRCSKADGYYGRATTPD